MNKKRKAPILKSLVNNSKSAIFAAIEIHNKPLFPYRYEIVILLVINSWELLLKAYIHKNLKKVKLFKKDGTSKQFSECLGCVKSDLGKEFFPTSENLDTLYIYRNQVAHFYTYEIDLILYSLLRKNIIFYTHFLKSFFKQDITEESNLILLPIGFKKFYSPLDFLSNKSILVNSSKELRDFIKLIIDSTERLSKEGIEETILVDFKLNLINENRIKNADIIAGINNSSPHELNFQIQKTEKKIKISSDANASPVTITRNKSQSSGVLVHEEISEGIFDEINNIIETNRILSKGSNMFQLGQPMYYRIYSERQHVDFNIDQFELLTNTGLLHFYSPFMFWITQLPATIIFKSLTKVWIQAKAPYINNLIKIAVLLGEEVTNWLEDKMNDQYKKHTQPPEYYYTFKRLMASKGHDRLLRVLGASSGKKIEIPGEKALTYQFLIDNPSIAIKHLSELSLSIFKGNVNLRTLARELDFIAYGRIIQSRSKEIEEVLGKSII